MVLAGVLYLLAILLSSPASPPAIWLLVANLGLSLLAIAQYGLDKKAAKSNRRRTPESALHLTALLGGWPGAAVAQGIFRHKTQKREFQTTFRATAVLNVVTTLAYLYMARR